jgi:hypothetical protein
LMFGIKKLETDVFVPSTVVTALAESVPKCMIPRWFNYFMALWSDRIQHECKGRNLFLPVAVGGMGHVRPPEVSNSFSPYQMEVARRIMAARQMDSFQYGPVKDPEPFPVPDSTASFPWDQRVANHDWDFDPALELERSFTARIARSSKSGEVPEYFVEEFCTRCQIGRAHGSCKCGSRAACEWSYWESVEVPCQCLSTPWEYEACGHRPEMGEVFFCDCCDVDRRRSIWRVIARRPEVDFESLSRPTQCSTAQRGRVGRVHEPMICTWAGQSVNHSGKFAALLYLKSKSAFEARSAISKAS